MQADAAFQQTFKKGGFDGRMSLTERGLAAWGAMLAKMGDGGLCIDGEEERILTLLSIAVGRAVSPMVLGKLRRASKLGQSGDKSLAAIHLAQSDLSKLDKEGAYRLSLAAQLMDAGVAPGELARELGLPPAQPWISKYDENQPRVPAGNGRESGRWTNEDALASTQDASESTLIEGRSASSNAGGVNIVHDLPKDAVVVTRPDGTSVDDPGSPTGKLMAPPRANFQEVYAAG